LLPLNPQIFLRSGTFDCQVAEIQVRIAVLNGYIALGIPVKKAFG
jgi:hypothetical protein